MTLPIGISVRVSPDLDAYASGQLDISRVRCVLCGYVATEDDCPGFGTPEYFALTDYRHGRASDAQKALLAAYYSPQARQARGKGPKPNIPAVILGQDDWLIYGRTADGRLIYTVIETDHHWLDAPSRGEAEYGSDAWRADNAYMQHYVSEHRADYDWRECDRDPVSGEYLGWLATRDAYFTTRAADTYLPR